MLYWTKTSKEAFEDIFKISEIKLRQKSKKNFKKNKIYNKKKNKKK